MAVSNPIGRPAASNEQGSGVGKRLLTFAAIYCGLCVAVAFPLVMSALGYDIMARGDWWFLVLLLAGPIAPLALSIEYPGALGFAIFAGFSLVQFTFVLIALRCRSKTGLWIASVVGAGVWLLLGYMTLYLAAFSFV